MFYSPSKRGFYSESVHGPRKIAIIDPTWEHPMIEVPDPEHQGEGEATTISVPDPDAEPHYTFVDNPKTTIPADAVEISDEEYKRLLELQAAGYSIEPGDNGKPVAIAPAVLSIETVRALAYIRIDADAERQRLKYITPGHGQAMVYSEKASEAVRFAADTSPTLGNYPLLMAEVGLTADTIEDVVQTILSRRNLWLWIAAKIERARLQAKKLVNESDSPEEIEAIVAGVIWEVEA